MRVFLTLEDPGNLQITYHHVYYLKYTELKSGHRAWAPKPVYRLPLWIRLFNKKDLILKEECYSNCKKYRNLLFTFMKESKQAYYDKYFERNWNNIKDTWKGIKSLTSLKTVTSSVPTVLSRDNADTITNPYDIGNTFNNYFVSIAETTKKS